MVTINFGFNDNDKPFKSLLKGKGLLPPVGLARFDEALPVLLPCEIYPF
jgi:hypothetical protein